MAVNYERDDYKAFTTFWERMRHCHGGRDAVLKAGPLYVPDLPGVVDANANVAYRKRGNFYNATQRTVQGLTGAIFQKPPEVKIPDAQKPYLQDITLSGITFEMFAVDAGREVMLLGRYGILVDMAVEGAIDNRPYAVGYRAEQIVNWKTARFQGDEELTMVVLKEEAETPDTKDPFECKRVCQYRVMMLLDGICVRQLWREKEPGNNEWVTYESAVVLQRRGEPLDFIPFVFIGTTHATSELEKPPLLDLADVNLAHWRNSVDYEYGLHLVALPTPWVSGAKGSGDANAPLRMGPSVVWELDMNGAAGMLEFSGEGLRAIKEAMTDKEKQMASLGARLLEEPVARDTATAVIIRHSGENASLRSIAGSIEQAFTQALQMMVWWDSTVEEPVDSETSVELNKAYMDMKASAQDIQAALAALQADEISFETWYDILVKGGWAREGVSAEEELEDIQERIDRTKSNEPPPPPPPVPPTPVKNIVRDSSGLITRIEG